MTNEEIRIAVAELCGYTWSKPHFGHDSIWHVTPISPGQDDLWNDDSSKWAGEPHDVQQEIQLLPNYPESLDACREFENKLNTEQFYAYWDILYAMISPINLVIEKQKQKVRWKGQVECARATPLQRCEAFLSLHNKWKD